MLFCMLSMKLRTEQKTVTDLTFFDSCVLWVQLSNMHRKKIKRVWPTNWIICQLLIFHSGIRSKEIVHTILCIVFICTVRCWHSERQRILTVSWFDSHIFSHSSLILFCFLHPHTLFANTKCYSILFHLTPPPPHTDVLLPYFFMHDT